MAATPEVLKPEIPEVQERQEQFVVPEKLQQGVPGIKVVQKNFTAQVKDDKGTPLIQTPPTQVTSVTPPASDQTLTAWSKGPATLSVSWLGMFWIRILKKAALYGWKIVSGSN